MSKTSGSDTEETLLPWETPVLRRLEWSGLKDPVLGAKQSDGAPAEMKPERKGKAPPSR